MTDYVADIAKFTNSVNEKAVEGIVKHLGIALRNKDSSLVSATDPKELARVRNGFMTKKLAREESDDEKDAVLNSVMEKMKGVRQKSRVTVYYLIAEHYGQLDLFVKK